MPTRGYRKGHSDTKVPMPRFVRTRLSDHDFALFTSEASSRDVTVSDFARAILTAHLKKQRAELPHPRGLSNDLLRQFARIGNNLNQLARQANAGMVGIPAEELRCCIDTLNSIARTL